MKANCIHKFKKWRAERRYKRAIIKGYKLHHKTNKKVLIAPFNGRWLVATKKEFKKMVRNKRFARNCSIQFIEQNSYIIEREEIVIPEV